MLRALRNIIISAFVLVVLFGAAGAAYVLLMGGKESDAKTEQPVAPPPAPAFPTPRKPNPKDPESAGLEVLTSPVKPGENSSITVQTQPTSNCTISVAYNNVPTKDSGLVPKTADAYGNVTWSWTVDPAAPEGTWPVKVTCVFSGKSAVVIGNLQVSKK
jgi:hypothetical protein